MNLYGDAFQSKLYAIIKVSSASKDVISPRDRFAAHKVISEKALAKILLNTVFAELRQILKKMQLKFGFVFLAWHHQ
jgi:hypothetical protein